MTNITLANRLWPQTASSGLLRNVVLAVAGSLLIALAAQITIPVQPVPFTLQTLAVLAVGAAYGSRLGAATLALYALEGAAGLPFFANGKSGLFDDKLDYLLPASSMGYVVGFILAAWVVGRIVETGAGQGLVKSVLATLLGAALIYVPGVAWLAVWAATTGIVPEGMSAISAAMAWGFYPFVMWDAVKGLLAGVLVPAVGMLLQRK